VCCVYICVCIGRFFGSETGVNFLSWISFAFPTMMINLVFSWIVLAFMFIPPRCQQKPAVIQAVTHSKHRERKCTGYQYFFNQRCPLLALIERLCNDRVPVRLSACLSRRSTAAATCSWFSAAGVEAADISCRRSVPAID